MMLSPLDLLYITLTLFITVVGTLLTLILFKVNRILGVADEISGYYYSFKRMLKAYEQIPQIVMDKVKDILAGSGEKSTSKKSS